MVDTDTEPEAEAAAPDPSALVYSDVLRVETSGVPNGNGKFTGVTTLGGKVIDSVDATHETSQEAANAAQAQIAAKLTTILSRYS